MGLSPLASAGICYPSNMTGEKIEQKGVLHAHTAYSDGALYHADLAADAARAGLDFLITTDHNIYVSGVDGWRTIGARRILLCAGEEIHHQDRIPQKNHLLVVGAARELSRLAPDPQALLDGVLSAGGAAFLAHPFDPAAPSIGEDALNWVDWQVRGFAGLEIWNYMSEFKSLLRGPVAALFYVFFPSLGITGPDPQTLAKWDDLLADGKRVSAVGGADVHGTAYALGPLRKTVFPYRSMFGALRNHILLSEPFSGDAAVDSRAIQEALAGGHSWVAYDRSAPSDGFRFRAEGAHAAASLGEEIRLDAEPVLRASLPFPADWKIIRAGKGPVAAGSGLAAVYRPREPGAYRFEAWRAFRGKSRGWIFSNPIFVA